MAEEFDGGIDFRRLRGAGEEIDPVEGVAIAAERELAFGSVGGVVVSDAGNAGESDGFEVERGEEFIETGNTGVVAKGVLLGAE